MRIPFPTCSVNGLLFVAVNARWFFRRCYGLVTGAISRFAIPVLRLIGSLLHVRFYVALADWFNRFLRCSPRFHLNNTTVALPANADADYAYAALPRSATTGIARFLHYVLVRSHPSVLFGCYAIALPLRRYRFAFSDCAPALPFIFGFAFPGTARADAVLFLPGLDSGWILLCGLVAVYWVPRVAAGHPCVFAFGPQFAGSAPVVHLVRRLPWSGLVGFRLVCFGCGWTRDLRRSPVVVLQQPAPVN